MKALIKNLLLVFLALTIASCDSSTEKESQKEPDRISISITGPDHMENLTGMATFSGTYTGNVTDASVSIDMRNDLSYGEVTINSGNWSVEVDTSQGDKLLDTSHIFKITANPGTDTEESDYVSFTTLNGSPVSGDYSISGSIICNSSECTISDDTPLVIYLSDSTSGAMIRNIIVNSGTFPVSFVFQNIEPGNYYTGSFLDSNQNLDLDSGEKSAGIEVTITDSNITSVDIELIGFIPMDEEWGTGSNSLSINVSNPLNLDISVTPETPLYVYVLNDDADSVESDVVASVTISEISAFPYSLIMSTIPEGTVKIEVFWDNGDGDFGANDLFGQTTGITVPGTTSPVTVELGWFLDPSEILDPDSFESDNILADAKVIAPGETQNRSLHAYDDIDLVTFNATAGVTYTITYTGEDIADMLLYDNSDEWFAMGWSGQPIEFFCESSGTYHLEISSSSGDTGEYTLSLDQAEAPEADSSEPGDNTSEGATTITPGVSQTHTLDSDMDADWFVFTASEDEHYSIYLNSMYNILYFYVYDASMNIVGNGDYLDTTLLENPVNGNYYILVEYLNGTGEYDIYVNTY